MQIIVQCEVTKQFLLFLKHQWNMVGYYALLGLSYQNSQRKLVNQFVNLAGISFFKMGRKVHAGEVKG